MSSVVFKNNGINVSLKNEPELKIFFKSIFETEGFKLNKISFIFTTDDFVLKLNKEFLKHDFLTDILTFQLSGDNERISSDIFISIERIKENAEKFKVSYLSELHRVMIHGILHLCGFSDKTYKLKSTMRRRENFYLKKLGFT